MLPSSIALFAKRVFRKMASSFFFSFSFSLTLFRFRESERQLLLSLSHKALAVLRLAPTHSARTKKAKQREAPSSRNEKKSKKTRHHLLHPMATDGAAARALELVKKADKRLTSFSLFGGNKYEEAAELLEKAATQYKLAKCCE